MVAFIIGDDSNVSRLFLGGEEALFPWGALQRGKRRREKDSFFPYRLEKKSSSSFFPLGAFVTKGRGGGGMLWQGQWRWKSRNDSGQYIFLFIPNSYCNTSSYFPPDFIFLCFWLGNRMWPRDGEREEPFLTLLVPLNESALVCLGKGGRGEQRNILDKVRPPDPWVSLYSLWKYISNTISWNSFKRIISGKIIMKTLGDCNSLFDISYMGLHGTVVSSSPVCLVGGRARGFDKHGRKRLCQERDIFLLSLTYGPLGTAPYKGCWQRLDGPLHTPHKNGGTKKKMGFLRLKKFLCEYNSRP